MPHIEGRKGEVTLPDGRIVSRQRASQLKNPEADYKRRRRYFEEGGGKAKHNRSQMKSYFKMKALRSKELL